CVEGPRDHWANDDIGGIRLRLLTAPRLFVALEAMLLRWRREEIERLGAYFPALPDHCEEELVRWVIGPERYIMCAVQVAGSAPAHRHANEPCDSASSLRNQPRPCAGELAEILTSVSDRAAMSQHGTP